MQVAFKTEQKGWKIKMGKILEAFANAELHADEVEKQSSEYDEIWGKICDLTDELEEKLNEEEQKLLRNLINTISDENNCYAQDKFIRGYCLGARMIMEVLSEQDTLFYGKEK